MAAFLVRRCGTVVHTGAPGQIIIFYSDTSLVRVLVGLAVRSCCFWKSSGHIVGTLGAEDHRELCTLPLAEA